MGEVVVVYVVVGEVVVVVVVVLVVVGIVTVNVVVTHGPHTVNEAEAKSRLAPITSTVYVPGTDG